MYGALKGSLTMKTEKHYELHGQNNWTATMETGETMRFESHERATQMATTFRAVGGIVVEVVEA
jgi:hypothetical protein